MNISHTHTLIESGKAKKFGSLVKHFNYFAEYDFNFASFRERKNLKILEIGVQGGGSLAMWQEYFEDPLIVGIDIDKSCEKFQRDRVRIYIGDQANEQFLSQVERENGPFDIIIDDGGHTMKQQITTFKTLFPLLSTNGIYVIEDLHTSYWPSFGGGFGKKSTMIGLLKKMIDEIHYQHIDSPRSGIFHHIKHHFDPSKVKPKNVYQKTVRSLYIADSIVFIHKESETPDRQKLVRL